MFNEIPKNWMTKKLDDVCNNIFSGGTPSRKKSDFWGGTYNWFSSGETRERFIKDTEEKITISGIEKSSTKLAQTNDVLMASAGQGFTRGQVSYSLIDTYINQSVISLTANQRFLDSKFLFYNLSNRYEELRKISDDNSIRGSITTKMLKGIKILLPSKKEQKNIVNILFSLDNKIENNNAIISNLEEQAQAIFKSWFVDFNPFQDGEFVDSELGKIPKGWEVLPLKEISEEIITGKTPSTKYLENYGDKIPFITIPDMHNNVYVIQTGRYLSEIGIDSQSKKTLPKNSVIVSCIATVGLVSIVAVESQTNQQINAVIPKFNVSPYYVFSFLKTQVDYLNNIGSSGSTTKNVNKTTFSNIKIIFPIQKIHEKYHEFCEPLFENILLLQEQNQTLAQLRDTLLPKLMSGEIRVGTEELEEVKNQV